MKKILLSICMLTFAITSFAQVTIWKDTVFFNGFPKDGGSHELHDTFYNNTASPQTITWSKSSDALLSGWSGVGICDNITCQPYAGFATYTSGAIPAGGKMTIDVQMSALATATDGCSYVNLHTSVGDVVYKYCTWPTATKDFDNNTFVTIYPNPATDYVNISLNDKRISNINVVNVIGKRIAKFGVDANKNADIKVDLDKVANGIYLLQFADINGKVLGVRRVTKQ